MNLEDIVRKEIRDMPEQEEILIKTVCELCKLFDADKKRINGMLKDALKYYKKQRYNLFEKTLDSLLHFLGLTTIPSNTGRIEIEQLFNEEKAKQYVRELDEQLQIIFQDLEKAEKDRIFLRQEVDRLSEELNSVNNEYADYIKKNEVQEKELMSNLQQILENMGKDNSPAGDDPFGVMLEDLGVSFTWDAAQNPNLFSEMKISNPDNSGIRQPAVMKNGRLVKQGLIYRLEENPEGTF